MIHHLLENVPLLHVAEPFKVHVLTLQSREAHAHAAMRSDLTKLVYDIRVRVDVLRPIFITRNCVLAIAPPLFQPG